MSAGSTNFPTLLDSNVVRNNTHEITSTDHNDSSVQIEAIEAKVGVDNSAVTTSLDYKLKSTSSSNPGHKHTLENGATDVTSSASEINVLDGQMGAWTSYTPSWTAVTTNPAIGNGTLSGAYQKIGRTVHFRIYILAGSTTTFGSGYWYLTLPVAWSGNNDYANASIGSATCANSAGYAVGFAQLVGGGPTDTIRIKTMNLGSEGNFWKSENPVTWTTGDTIHITGTYEAAV